ncbi:MAG: 50S ribosomal protein L21 [Myxococcales bacterium]
MYAVVKTGGKQYRVNEGDVLRVEKLDGEKGARVQLDVLMVGGNETPKVGRPTVPGAKVEAEIVFQGRHGKIVHYHKQKEGYTYKRGHRQPFTELKITSIHA